MPDQQLPPEVVVAGEPGGTIGTSNSEVGVGYRPAIAREVTLSRSTVNLMKFVRFTDFVPCAYSEDNIADLLLLSSNLSVGYGYTGVGNGMFFEGPSFDLPFRPAAVSGVGGASEVENGVLLVSAEGTLSIFYPVIADSAATRVHGSSLFIFQAKSPEGVLFALYDRKEGRVRTYSLTGGSLNANGAYPIDPAVTPNDWYQAISNWGLEGPQEAFPVPPRGMEKTICVHDFNKDSIDDLAYYEAGKVVYELSWEGKTLEKKISSPCHTEPIRLRLSDVDGNGFTDVLALLPSGILEVYLTVPQ